VYHVKNQGQQHPGAGVFHVHPDALEKKAPKPTTVFEIRKADGLASERVLK